MGPAGPTGSGLVYLGPWSATASYLANALVSYDQSLWIALAPSTGVAPGTSAATWVLAVSGTPGPAGPTGPTGPAGAAGATGSTGSAGPAGPVSVVNYPDLSTPGQYVPIFGVARYAARVEKTSSPVQSFYAAGAPAVPVEAGGLLLFFSRPLLSYYLSGPALAFLAGTLSAMMLEALAFEDATLMTAIANALSAPGADAPPVVAVTAATQATILSQSLAYFLANNIVPKAVVFNPSDWSLASSGTDKVVPETSTAIVNQGVRGYFGEATLLVSNLVQAGWALAIGGRTAAQVAASPSVLDVVMVAGPMELMVTDALGSAALTVSETVGCAVDAQYIQQVLLPSAAAGATAPVSSAAVAAALSPS